MEEKEYRIKVTFCISYDIKVTSENEDDAIRQATDYAIEDFNIDLCGNLDAGDFGVIAEPENE